MRYAFGVLLVMTGLAGRASGQQSAPRTIVPGDTVRLWSEIPGHQGTRAAILRPAGDTLLLSVYSRASREWMETPVAAQNVTRLDVLDGKRPSRKRAALGVLAGGVLGAGAGGYIAWRTSRIYCNTTPCASDATVQEAFEDFFRIGFSALFGASVGGTAGFMIGHRPIEQWRRAYP